MKPDRPLHDLFSEALERTGAMERSRFLDEACGTDESLRARVEKLLRAHDEAAGFMADPSRKAAMFGLEQAVPGTAPTEHPGDRIGRYKLLQLIGEGGCGVVYMAEQDEPVRRRVALKVIKLGMDTRQVIARFEAERQALALMDHPNIARVLDASATQTGRPFFVMELVRGTKLTQFCDERQLSPRERLELFIPVCQAIQHAHQKGIIHRDLKPSNILVTVVDGKPVPKVIDFGIAKATNNRRLTDLTLFTAFEQFIGTPAYMSPEQAELSGVDVDTRTDIYSLGVVLYELPTGRTPFDREQLLRAGIDEIRRTICETEPPKPSTRLRRLSHAELTTTAQARQTEAPKLIHQMRGDLDWIVMKCLEKERDRRYATASDLARDVERHLESEPVTARPPSRLYEFQKAVRRHRFGFAAATMVLLVLCAGIAGTGWGLVRAERAREREAQRADGERQAKREALAAAAAEREAKETALAREAETKAVLEFVENKVFAAARPEGQDQGLGHDIALRKAMEAALPFIETTLTNQPLIEARLRMTVGWSFWCLGEAKIAAEQFEAARGLYTRLRGSDHPDTLRSMNNLANSYGDLGRHIESLKLHEETLALRKAILGPDHSDTLFSMNNVAFGYATAKRYDEAIKLGQESLVRRTKTLGPDHPDTLMSRMVLSRAYGLAGSNAMAIQMSEETLALQKARLGPMPVS